MNSWSHATTVMKSQNGQITKMRLGAVLVLSLMLNLALAFAAVKLRQETAVAPAPRGARPTAVVSQVMTLPSTTAPSAVTCSTNEFCWRLIVSTNYEQYVANLRGVGCPEKTVRAIVLPDIKRHYAALSRQTETKLPFWTGGKKLQAIRRSQHAQEAALKRKQADLIWQLFGIEYHDRRFLTAEMDEQAVARYIIGPMTEEKFLRVISIAEKSQSLKYDFDERTDDLPTAAEKVEAKETLASGMRQLQAVLSPAEFEELEARLGAAELFADRIFKDNLFDVSGLNPHEARQVSLAWFESKASDLFDLKAYETDEERERHRVQFTNAAVQTLGPKRFAEYLRAQDDEFVGLVRLARENQLPRESAVQVYEMQQLAAQEVERIRNDESLEDAARNRSYEEIQAELQRTVSGILGAEAYKDYVEKYGGNWVTNVSKLKL
jgi:hypothetical protein